MTTVICFGTFDVLHLGHLNYFQQAKKFADYLMVVIARDKNTNKKTLFNENERLELIKNLSIVDEAVLGDLDDQFKIITKKQPNFICLGYDHPIQEEKLQKELNKFNINPKIIRTKAFHPEKYKSSKIKS